MSECYNVIMLLPGVSTNIQLYIYTYQYVMHHASCNEQTSPAFRRLEIAMCTVEAYLQPHSTGSTRQFTENAVVRVLPKNAAGGEAINWRDHLSPAEQEEGEPKVVNAICVSGQLTTTVIELLKKNGAVNKPKSVQNSSKKKKGKEKEKKGDKVGDEEDILEAEMRLFSSVNGDMLSDATKSKKTDSLQHPYLPPIDLFDELDAVVFSYLEYRHFEGFRASAFYTKYHGFLCLAEKSLTEDDFSLFRVLGRGGFGLVNGCKKCTSGKLFAMKVMDKRRVKLKKSENLCVNERNILAMVDSPFMVNMKYSFSTPTELFLILDLMTGGDLGFLLNRLGKLSIEHAR
jgi:hypothetical protein